MVERAYREGELITSLSVLEKQPIPDEPAEPAPAVPVNPASGLAGPLWILAILAIFATLCYAQAIFLPAAMAIFLALLFRPVVRKLAKWRIPESVSAGVLLFGFLGIFGVAVAELQGPANQWIRSAPADFDKIQEKLRGLIKPIKGIQKATERVGNLAPDDAATKPVQVEIKQPRLSNFLGTTTSLIAGLVVMLSLSYFLLATGDHLLLRVVQITPGLREKKNVVELVKNLEHAVSSYLISVTLINAGLGAAQALAMWLIGLPNAILWGCMIALLNFIPYVGAIISTMIIVFVSLLTFDSLWEAAIPPAIFVVISALEGNLLTPWILGRSFQLNPIMVFLSLTLWGFIWGVGGMLMAVPILAVLKISCDQFESTKPVARVLHH